MHNCPNLNFLLSPAHHSHYKSCSWMKAEKALGALQFCCGESNNRWGKRGGSTDNLYIKHIFCKATYCCSFVKYIMLLVGNELSCILQIVISLQIPPYCDSENKCFMHPFFLINAQDTQHGWIMLYCFSLCFKMKCWRDISTVQYHT